MSEPESQPQEGLAGKASARDRTRLHRWLDKLLDQQDIILGQLSDAQMSVELADSLQARSNDLVRQSVRLASEAAGVRSREIAFRHTDPDSRAAFSNFLGAVADFAAPDRISEERRGIATFKFSDVIARIDDLQALEHGHVPPRLEPADQSGPIRTSHFEAKERLRAALWVHYLTGRFGKKASAVFEVADAYDVAERSIYNWLKAALSSENRDAVSLVFEMARLSGEREERPNFTQSPIQFDTDETIEQMLAHDGNQYKIVCSSES